MSAAKHWVLEHYDAHWGGWKPVRKSWDTEEPAVYANKATAERMFREMCQREPRSQFRVTDVSELW